jgi:hypothetical protein
MYKGVSNWFHNVSTYSEEVIENIFFIENSFKLKKLQWNLGTLLVLLENFQFIGFDLRHLDLQKSNGICEKY